MATYKETIKKGRVTRVHNEKKSVLWLKIFVKNKLSAVKLQPDK